MSWIKQGLIYKPDTTLYWQHSHAALPTFMHLEDSLYRVYFTSRDKSNATYIGYFEIDLKNPKKILKTSDSPVLTPGRIGCFDHHGVQATSIIKHDGLVYLYYLGWTKALPAPLFYTAIGLAISEDNGKTFTKHSEAPIMERSKYDPWMVSGGTVIKEGNLWRIWYLSGIEFNVEPKVSSKYDIKYAESKDGINWERNGIVAMPLQNNETNISRLAIVKSNNQYQAWFPVKKQDAYYRFGYAVSSDGINWLREDYKAGIDVSERGWDSDALDKLDIVQYDGNLFMLYNGNNYGYDGIGLAIKSN